MVKIDIDYLIDRLEAVINAGKRVPMTTRIMIDEQDCLDILDQMRIVIPEEIKQAKRTMVDRERIIAQAQSEADKIIELAKQQAQFLVNEKGLLAEAEQHRDTMVQEAEAEADRIRQGADGYAHQVLSELEEVLSRQLNSIRKGMNALSSH